MVDLKLMFDGDMDLTSGDLVFSKSTEQHKRDLLIAGQGDYKESPTLGVCSMDFLLDTDPSDYLRTVRKQFERDGMRVMALEMNAAGELMIDAEYEDSNR